MRKKILIAEKSDAIRNIAESLLHQHGYDVISSASADKAKELIITSEPNLVIIDSSLKDRNDAFLYDLLEESEQTASIPFLIIADADGPELSYPPEVILSRPFETEDFLNKVKLFIGPGIDQKTKEVISEKEPFSIGDVNDSFLDAALGIDHIDVESSEVMDQTTITEKAETKKKTDETTDFGIAYKNESKANDDDNSNKVESLLIREDGSEQKILEKEELPDLSASSKIDIPTDQFDISGSKGPGSPERAKETKTDDHDYDWFINEMKKETGDIKFDKPGKDAGSQKIQTTNAAMDLNPIMPSKEKDAPDKPEIKVGGVDQFISEFKQEMEQSAPESAKTPAAPKPGKTEPGMEIELDINQIADFIAEKIVDRLMAKINKEDISSLIKEYLPQIKSAQNIQK